MTRRRVLVTGASGCVGHYVVDALVRETDHELFLLVRDPARLRVPWNTRPGVHLVVGDMRAIAEHAALLATLDAAVLTAAAWGGERQVLDVNVDGTLALLRRLDPARCDPVLYFSTASILDRDHRPLPEAARLGTEYIRSKVECARAIAGLAIAPRVVTLYPTLVIGGDARHPDSHPARLLRQALRWAGLLRFFTADGSFHFVHARDAARIVRHLIDHPEAAPPPRELVLGSAPVRLADAVAAACAVAGRRRAPVRVPLTTRLAEALIALCRVRVTPWDRHCMTRRHLVYDRPVDPGHFGLPVDFPDIAGVLRSLLPPPMEPAGRLGPP
jgi:nucleoside-diphosphate-sugar epimerase